MKTYTDPSQDSTVTYTYDDFNRLKKVVDAQTVDLYYEYDFSPYDTVDIERLVTEYTYDAAGRTASVEYTFEDESYTNSVVYDPRDRIKSFTTSGVFTKANTYDYFNFLSKTEVSSASGRSILETSYGYVGGLLSSEVSSLYELDYTYDAANRIIGIGEHGEDFVRYTYDSQGQLISEINYPAKKTWTYTYDKYGNILTKTTYDHLEETSSVKNWSYTDSSMGKQLAGYYYDNIGNPTYDENRYWTYTWNGRLLTEIMQDGGYPVFQAEYNADGIRTYKGYSEDGIWFVRHDYILEGSRILKETVYESETPEPHTDRYTNYYYYDENGSLIGLNYNGTDYYYYKNILGDILGIINSLGALVVEYSYDAWGNILSVTGSLASTLGEANPFRYRGYYYDVETGYYYLNSRYYDPANYRFINADDVILIGTAAGCNLYAYCFNDLISYIDTTGHGAESIAEVWKKNPSPFSDGFFFYLNN